MKLKDHAFAIKEKEDDETDEKTNTCNLSKSDEYDCEGSASSSKLSDTSTSDLVCPIIMRLTSPGALFAVCAHQV